MEQEWVVAGILTAGAGALTFLVTGVVLVVGQRWWLPLLFGGVGGGFLALGYVCLLRAVGVA